MLSPVGNFRSPSSRKAGIEIRIFAVSMRSAAESPSSRKAGIEIGMGWGGEWFWGRRLPHGRRGLKLGVLGGHAGNLVVAFLTEGGD